jgi:hypothetical protein
MKSAAGDREFKRDRIGHNGNPGSRASRTTYMAHGKGYVMVRHPGSMPFTVTEKEWLAFPFWEKPKQESDDDGR